MFKKIIINASILASTLVLIPLSSYASTYGSNFLTGGTCSASSEHAIGQCANAFDTNLATRWGIADSQIGNYPMWVELDLGSGITKKFNKITLNIYNDGGYQYGKDFQILGSNDDWSSSSTIFIGQLTKTTNDFTNGTTETFTFDSSTSTAYRYYRINFTSSMSPANGVWSWDIYGYECTDCNVATSSTSTILSTDNEMINEYLMLFMDIIFIGSIIAGLIWIQSKF